MEKAFLSSIPDHKRQVMVPTGVKKTFSLLFLSVHKPADLPRNPVFHSFVTVSLSKSKENVKLY